MAYCPACNGNGVFQTKKWDNQTKTLKCHVCNGTGTTDKGTVSTKVLMREDDEAKAEQVVNLAQERTKRNTDASKWTPRDALMSIINDIDSGKITPECLVIGYAEGIDTTIVSGFRWAGPNSMTGLAMIAILREDFLSHMNE